MAVDRRRLQWLGATLVVAVLAVIAIRSGSEPAPATEPARGRPAAANKRGAAAQADNVAPPVVDLAALQLEREAPADAGRDPFRFQQRAAPPPPEPKRIPGVPDDQVDAPPPPRVPAGPPPPPPITLKFIGRVEMADGRTIAVLSDGKRPIQAFEGQEIEGRYKVWKIGTESIEISYIDGRGRQTIRLTGQ
jgi:hypothetical protein